MINYIPLLFLSLGVMASSSSNAAIINVNCGNYKNIGIQAAVNQAKERDTIKLSGKCRENIYVDKSLFFVGSRTTTDFRETTIWGRIKIVHGRVKLKKLFVYGNVSVEDSGSLTIEESVLDDEGRFYESALNIQGNSYGKLVSSVSFGTIAVGFNSSFEAFSSELKPGFASMGGVSDGSVIDIEDSSVVKINKSELADTLINVSNMSVLKILNSLPVDPGQGSLRINCSNSTVIAQNTSPTLMLDLFSPPTEPCVFK